MSIDAPTRLERLLSPRSIAFIGGRDAAEAVRVCRRFGFEGEIWPISRSRADMDGLTCLPDLDALPLAPDAAFVGVNREASVDIMARLSAMNAGGAIAYASGFAESIGEIDGGAALQSRLVEAAGAMPMLGPNCYGLINAATGASIWPSEHGVARAERGVALISQSTNIVISMTMQRRGLPVAFVGTIGNQAQTGLSTLGRAVLALPNVTALGLHIEAIDDAQGFEALAADARRLGKPIAAIKTGRSEGARVATLSHTASIAGPDEAADAFFHRLGVARVGSITALIETLKLLHVLGPLTGPKLGAICCSGGEAALLSDAVEGRSIAFPPLSDARRAAIKATLNPMVAIANPLDHHTFIWGDYDRLVETYTSMLAERFDLGLLTLDWVRTDRCSDADWWPELKAIETASQRTGAKTAVMSTIPENMPEAIAERLVAAGLAPLAGVDDAMSAVDAAWAIGDVWSRPAPPALTAVPLASVPFSAASGDVTSGVEDFWDEAASKAALAAFGAPTPPGAAATPDAAYAVAKTLGGLVAVKALGVAHKSDVGGVQLGVAAEAAAEAAAEMAARLGVSRVLVEAMAGRPVAELIVGVTRAAPFGLALTIGAGGVLAEILDDAETVLLPTDAATVRAAVSRLKIAPLLAGYRGGASVDLDDVAAAVLSIADFAVANADRLVELDVNPLMLTEDGPIVADALIRMDPADLGAEAREPKEAS